MSIDFADIYYATDVFDWIHSIHRPNHAQGATPLRRGVVVMVSSRGARQIWVRKAADRSRGRRGPACIAVLGGESRSARSAIVEPAESDLGRTPAGL
jgi:hypothetical protein